MTATMPPFDEDARDCQYERDCPLPAARVVWWHKIAVRCCTYHLGAIAADLARGHLHYEDMQPPDEQEDGVPA